MGRRSFTSWAPVWAFLTLAALPGCDETAKQCFDAADTAVTHQISACGELCDKDDGKACAKQAELATKACLEEGDAEICRWMCDYAKDGKELYCKKHEELGGN